MARKPDFVRIVEAGNRADSLKALRDLLAARLVKAETKDSAPVARQLMAVIKELDALGIGREESPADEARRELEAGRADALKMAQS